ncbi:MAG: serine hydrolase [Burkholderiales bacterium]|nr:serine hydrolase [Burkholderiales bacterium]
MKRRSFCFSSLWATTLLIVGAPSQASLWADAPMGTGYAAWELCTRVMQGNDDLARVRERYTAPKVSPLSKVWSVDVSMGHRVEVNTWLPLDVFKRVAVFRPGLGCTLVPPGIDEAAVLRQPLQGVVANGQALPSRAPWPLGEGVAEPTRLTPAQQALVQRWSDTLFDEAPAQARQNTVAVLVAKDGHLVHERYAPGYNQDQPQLGWSLTKTLTAMWAGSMVGEGRFKLDDPAPVGQWVGTDKARITWRHLLNMAPGLFWDEGHKGFSSTSEMLFSMADQGDYAAVQAVVAAPGSAFNYSTGTTAIVSKALRTVLGGDAQASYDHLQKHLFQPLGMRHAVLQADASGTPIGGAGGVLRPRDWFRLGELVRNDGRWNGQALVSDSFVRFMKTPSPANPGYGGFMRLHDPKELPKGTATDVVYFAGLMGQYLVIIPSQQLMVLRMGVSFDQEDTKRRVFEMATALAASLPSETPKP